MERKIVGFDRDIQLAWLDATADWASQGLSIQEVRERLCFLLQDVLSARGSRSARGKTITVLRHIWLAVPSDLEPLRNEGLAMLPDLSHDDRLMLHWGMSVATYPFFRDTAMICGRLMSLQGSVTLSQVVRRIKELWGDRSTAERSARRVVRSMVSWGALLDTEEKGTYTAAPKQSISRGDPRGPWLIEAIIAGSKSRPFQSIVTAPELFPFSLDISPREVESSARLELSRQGVNEDIVIWLGAGVQEEAKTPQQSLW